RKKVKRIFLKRVNSQFHHLIKPKSHSMRRTSSIIPTSIKKIAMEDRLGLLSSSVDSIGFGGGLLRY
ncbi:MAG: hypothetical protein KA281_11170, partial [Bacteroidia bacterium]|nr:hypothetical protein [Bacteroidia bacterium]